MPPTYEWNPDYGLLGFGNVSVQCDITNPALTDDTITAVRQRLDGLLVHFATTVAKLAEVYEAAEPPVMASLPSSTETYGRTSVTAVATAWVTTRVPRELLAASMAAALGPLSVAAVVDNFLKALVAPDVPGVGGN
jgi:hypothetical protein